MEESTEPESHHARLAAGCSDPNAVDHSKKSRVAPIIGLILLLSVIVAAFAMQQGWL